MKKQRVSAFALVVTVLTLSLSGGNIAFGLTSGDEVNIEFGQPVPTPIPQPQSQGVANGTITLGAAIAGKPGVFRVSTFGVTIVDSGIGIVFNPANLLFDTNARLLSGSAGGMYVSSGAGTHTLGLTVSGNNWTFTDTKVSTGIKQVSKGTYFATAAPAVALYDDFSAPLINPDKWFGDEGSGGGGKLAEVVRLVQTNGLRLFSRSNGAADLGCRHGARIFRTKIP
jgi:hypothetical protein